MSKQRSKLHVPTQNKTNHVLFTAEKNEPITLTEKQKTELFKKIFRILGSNDYFVIKGTLWELLKWMVANSPETIEKWLSVRWLLSEIAKFSQEDYGKTITPNVSYTPDAGAKK